MSHLHSTKDHGLEGFLGDPPELCSVVAYCDASFADDLQSSKSTSGLFLAIVGPNTFMPITSFAKRQTAVSHSTTESEMVSLEEGLRTEALPTLTFWEHVVQLFSEPAGNLERHADQQEGEDAKVQNKNEVTDKDKKMTE